MGGKGVPRRTAALGAPACVVGATPAQGAPAFAPAVRSWTARTALAALAALGLGAAPAAAAGWLPPEVLTEQLQPRLDRSVAAGDGTVLFEQDGQLVRRSPGGTVLRTPLPDDTATVLAASRGGVVAALLVTETGDDAVRRILSWRPGAQAPTETGPWTTPCFTRSALVLFDDAHVGVLEPECAGEALLQRTGELGGALSTATVEAPAGAATGLNRLGTAAREGQAPVAVVSAGRRLLLTRATGRTFGPLTVAAGDAGGTVGFVVPSIAADGSLGLAYTTTTSGASGSSTVVRAGRITTEGLLADARELATLVVPGPNAGESVDVLGSVSSRGGGQVVALGTTLRGTSNRTRVITARRAAGVVEPVVQPLFAEPPAQGQARALGLVASGTDAASLVVYDAVDDPATERVVAHRFVDAGAPVPETLMQRDVGGGGSLGGFAAGAHASVAMLATEDGTTLRTLDAGPPALSIDRADPDGALAVRFAAAASDALSGPPAVTWRFGDGAEAAGPEVRHAFARPGRYEVTAVATDATGETATATRVVEVAPPPAGGAPAPPAGGASAPPPPAAVAADRTAPVLSRVRLAARRVRRGRAATLRFTLSEAAAVRVQLVRRVPGVRRGVRCVAGRARSRRGRCTREVVVRTATVRLAAGARSVRLETRGLPRGPVLVRAVATDASGNASPPAGRRLEVRR